VLQRLKLVDSPYLYARANDAAFSGYPEYDALPVLHAVIKHSEGDKVEGDITVVDDLRVAICDQAGREVDGADLKAVFYSEDLPSSYLDCDFRTVVHKDHQDPLLLADLLEDYGYDHNPDNDESEEETRRHFCRAAEQFFFTALMSKEQAMRHAVTKALDELLLPCWNHGKAWGDKLTIHVARVTEPGEYPREKINVTFE
jgi:hypothetical protein